MNVYCTDQVSPHSHDLISQLSIKRSGWQWTNYIQMIGCNILVPGATLRWRVRVRWLNTQLWAEEWRQKVTAISCGAESSSQQPFNWSSQEKQYHWARTSWNFENSMLNFSLQYKSLVQSIDYRSDRMNEVWSFQSVNINVRCSAEQERTLFLFLPNIQKETILVK